MSFGDCMSYIITIKESDYQKILDHARKNAPEEACGLIAGTETEEPDAYDQDGTGVHPVKHIEKVYLLENIDHSEEHFSLDPKDQFAVIKDMRANGLKLLGNWHSHPASPSRPSAEDKRLAYDEHASYLIMSLQNKNHPVLQSFHVSDKQTKVTVEELIVIDD